MADLTLYHATPSRSATALWMLEEVGEPYDIHLLSLANGDQLRPEHRAVNPLGKVPALRHKGVAFSEVSAICTYLADEFPQAKLNIPIGDPRRGVYLRWMFFGPSVVEPAITDRAFPRQDPARASAVGWRDIDTVADILADAVKSGPWLMGEQFTAADVVIGAGIRWGTMFKLMPMRPAFEPYIARLVDRPALKRSEAKDKEFASTSQKN